MELVITSDADLDVDPAANPPPPPGSLPVRTRAYRFDSLGNYQSIDWDQIVAVSSSSNTNSSSSNPSSFYWFQVDLPKPTYKNAPHSHKKELSSSAQSLISCLCPPLNLHDILSLAGTGPFCSLLNSALIFRLNSSGPASSDFTLRLAARVTESSVITVSLGRVPRLGFTPVSQSLLTEIPAVDSRRTGGVVIGEDLLESLLMMNHTEEADRPVPRRVSDLLLHIVETHVDQVQDIITRLEMELDSVEIDLDRGTRACLELWMLCTKKYRINLN